MTHEEIKQKYQECKKCTNCQNGKKVFGHGNLTSKIAVIGEGPGREEVQEGKPFVGPAGKMLDKILEAVNLRKSDLFYTNAILCRTSDTNRTPTQEECSNCRQRLFEELTLVSPRFVLLAGSTALSMVFGEKTTITRAHGKWLTLLSKPCYYYFPIYHPAWILHSSTEGEEKGKKKTMWDDTRKFAQELKLIESLIIKD